MGSPTRIGGWGCWKCRDLSLLVEGQRRRRRNWVYAADELPGVAGGRHVERECQRKHGSTRGSPRRRVRRTAKASRISRSAVKSRCAWEWGAWDQLSDDGPGQHNPDRSEGPWGRAAVAARTEVHQRTASLDTERDRTLAARCTKGGRKPNDGKNSSRPGRRRLIDRP